MEGVAGKGRRYLERTMKMIKFCAKHVPVWSQKPIRYVPKCMKLRSRTKWLVQFSNMRCLPRHLKYVRLDRSTLNQMIGERFYVVQKMVKLSWW
jgi:hypothetical protein